MVIHFRSFIFTFLFSCVPIFIHGMNKFADLKDLRAALESGQFQVDPEQIKIDMGTLAAIQGDLESLKHFIDASNVNKPSSQQRLVVEKALGFAFKSKDETKYGPVLNYLLSIKAEIQKPVTPNRRISPFELAATWACLENYTRPVEILLATGVNPFIPSTEHSGSNAAKLCTVASKDNHQPAINVLKLFEPHVTNLSEALDCLSVEKVKQFANAPVAQTTGTAKLHHPLEKAYGLYKEGIVESFSLIETLFSQGMHPHDALPTHPLPGFTFMLLATMHALQTGDTKLIELCLEHKADPRYKAFPMASSAIEMVKSAARLEPNNIHLVKVRAFFNT